MSFAAMRTGTGSHSSPGASWNLAMVLRLTDLVANMTFNPGMRTNTEWSAGLRILSPVSSTA